MRTRRALWMFSLALVAAAALIAVLPGSAYVIELSNGSPNHWPSATQVVWMMNPDVGSNVAGGTAAAQTVVARAFSTWNSAPNTSVRISYAGTSSLTTHGNDGTNLVCFVCQGDWSKDGSTLAVTYTTSDSTGQLIDADILFNPSVQWSTSGTPASGQQDLETVAVHEQGHFLGLDHSAIIRSIMYPFAPQGLTTLSYDDVAAVSSLYPKATPDTATGTITGTVHFEGGAAVFGAHVWAQSTSASTSPWPKIRKTPIGALTRPDGTYTITGLPADSYQIGAEPIDGPMKNENVDWATSWGKQSVDATFNTRWH